MKKSPRTWVAFGFLLGRKKFWKDFERRVLHLVEAGYPGCIGCGGPGKDDVWNEGENRIKLRKEIN